MHGTAACGVESASPMCVWARRSAYAGESARACGGRRPTLRTCTHCARIAHAGECMRWRVCALLAGTRTDVYRGVCCRVWLRLLLRTAGATTAIRAVRGAAHQIVISWSASGGRPAGRPTGGARVVSREVTRKHCSLRFARVCAGAACYVHA